MLNEGNKTNLQLKLTEIQWWNTG